jgi:hypothetical protein
VDAAGEPALRGALLTTSPSAHGPRDAGLTPALVGDLTDWRVHLHGGSFTQVAVDMLLRDLRRTVHSALGYRLVLMTPPGLPEVSITAADRSLPAGRVASTLTFALPAAHGIEARATFFAGDEQAFDELARLLRLSESFGAGPVDLGGALDADLEPGVHGLTDHTRVNHAFGVLLGRGESVEEAERHLRDLARRLGSVQAAAEHVLSAVDG